METTPRGRRSGRRSGGRAAVRSRFFAYHARNPDLYALFLRYAREAKDRGRGRFSSWMIGNRVWWYTSVETTGPLYKLTNDYFALYARLIVFEHPEFEGFFEFRP